MRARLASTRENVAFAAQKHDSQVSLETWLTSPSTSAREGILAHVAIVGAQAGDGILASVANLEIDCFGWSTLVELSFAGAACACKQRGLTCTVALTLSSSRMRPLSQRRSALVLVTAATGTLAVERYAQSAEMNASSSCVLTRSVCRPYVLKL